MTDVSADRVTERRYLKDKKKVTLQHRNAHQEQLLLPLSAAPLKLNGYPEAKVWRKIGGFSCASLPELFHFNVPALYDAGLIHVVLQGGSVLMVVVVGGGLEGCFSGGVGPWHPTL